MVAPIRLRLNEIFRIGLGPSSSHTVGPMRAAARFRAAALERGILPHRVEVDLKGSLSATGRGHGTLQAVLAGLQGWDPETCDVDAVHALPQTLAQDPSVEWGPGRTLLTPDAVRFLPYAATRDEVLPHANTLVLRALAEDGTVLLEETWCSVGGGFVCRADKVTLPLAHAGLPAPLHPFHSGATLVAAARRTGLPIGEVVLENERAWEPHPEDVAVGLDRVWTAFGACIARGLARDGELPGGLGMRRRARDLLRRVDEGKVDPAYADMARAQAYAFAVNEENAAGGRVVTAPTNGAAGIVPAVLYELAERWNLSRPRIHRALATAGAVGMLIKTHASISGAEVGCQGEVGAATAMAAAALCEALGGTPEQVEYAAEIAIEHNLGLTCDPLKGLVQAPCIERNAMGVTKAWSSAQLALHSDGRHVISLDRVIHVMRRTGEDMKREYKETSEGGLAVSLPEC
jgi:L-serine dehydratase